MTATRNRQPKGIPAGGQFAPDQHAEPGVSLTTPAAPHPELEVCGPIPAPAEGQAYADGAPITAATFEEAYAEFFRPLDEHEAVHGPYQSKPGPSEGELQALAGIENVYLGEERGTSLEKEEDGEPVIVVLTRSGGDNRECWGGHSVDHPCTGCIQTDVIPALPTYLRDEDADFDRSYCNNYFRPVDPEAGRALLAAEDRRRRLHLAAALRDAIASGDQPPWAVLSHRRGDSLPSVLRNALSVSTTALSRAQGRAEHVEAVEESLHLGTRIETKYSLNIPLREGIAYNSAVERRDKAAAELAAAKDQLTGLRGEYSPSLPPKIRALARDELGRLEIAVDTAGERLATAAADADRAGGAISRLAQVWKDSADQAQARYEEVQASVKDFWWSNAWPGDVLADCPPRPVH